MPIERVVLEEAVGLETTGNTHTPVLVRGLHLPASWSKTFRTAQDDQEEMAVHVLQGNPTDGTACRQVARFVVADLPKRLRHGVSFLVTLSIDSSGLLSMSARDPSGQELEVRGSPSAIRTQRIEDFSGLGGQWGSW